MLRNEDIKGRWLSRPGTALLQDVDGDDAGGGGGDADGQD